MTKRDYCYLGIFFISFTFYTASGFFIKGSLLTGSNNDIYNWGLSTNTLMGISDYENIMPSGIDIWKSLRQDCFGAYILNGFLANIFDKNVLFFAALNIFAISIFYQFSIYRLLSSNGLSKTVSFLMTFFWLANPTFIYLEANYFLSQLLAGLFMFVGLIPYLEAYRCGARAFFRVAGIVPSIFIIFITYQSGFLAILLGFFLIGFVLRLHHSSEGEDIDFSLSRLRIIIKTAAVILKDMVIAMSICLLLSLDTAKHLWIQANLATHVVAGWSLPMINPFTLVGLPSTIPIESPASFTLYLLFGLLLINLIGYRRVFSLNYLAIGFWIVFSLLSLYVLGMEFNNRENNYQIWKAATFIILPFGCIFISMALDAAQKKIHNTSKVVILFAGIMISFNSYSNLSNLYFSSYDSIINNFVSLRNELPRESENKIQLVLDTDAYTDTFIAFNVFSERAEVYPLNNWYSVPVEVADLNISKSYVICPVCGAKSNEKYRLCKNTDAIFYYEFGSGGCGFLSHFMTINNLYLSEPTGTWSQGNEVSFDFKMDELNYPRPQEIAFVVDPYLPPGVTGQNIKTFVNGKFVESNLIKRESMIRVPVSNSEKLVRVEFLIEKTRRPADYGQASKDTRDIALFFKRVSYVF